MPTQVDLEQLALRLSAVADFLEERSERAVQLVAQGTHVLDQTAHGLGAMAQQLSREVVETIGAQAEGAIQRAIGRATAEYNAQLQEAARTAAGAARQLEEQRDSLRRVQQGLLWKGLTALLIGTVLAAGGSSYVAWNNMREVKRAAFAKDILRATQSGVLTRCGDALCVKVDQRARRFGAKGEYLLLTE